jgi:hypothetical protein
MTVPGKDGDVSRRGALGVLGAVAGGVALVQHAVAAEDNPAAQVADAAAKVRITGLRTHRVQHKVYVELQTSHKVTGWGEVSALVPTAAEELARALYELLDGENPTRIEHLWQKLYRAHRDVRGRSPPGLPPESGAPARHTSSCANLLVGDFRHAAMGTIVLRQTKIARTTRESRPPGRR